MLLSWPRFFLRQGCFCLALYMYVFTLILFIYLVAQIRLAGTNSHNYGRVEVYYNGEWGTVCDDGWNTADATVVCRQLGFYSSVTAYGSARYGQGTGPIWLSRLSCIGNESSLFECGRSSVETKNCTHSDDAAVYCWSNRRKQIIIETILVNYS